MIITKLKQTLIKRTIIKLKSKQQETVNFLEAATELIHTYKAYVEFDLELPTKHRDVFKTIKQQVDDAEHQLSLLTKQLTTLQGIYENINSN